MLKLLLFYVLRFCFSICLFFIKICNFFYNFNVLGPKSCLARHVCVDTVKSGSARARNKAVAMAWAPREHACISGVNPCRLVRLRSARAAMIRPKTSTHAATFLRTCLRNYLY